MLDHVCPLNKLVYPRHVLVRLGENKHRIVYLICVCVRVSGARDAGSSPQGQWVYVSDTTVQTVPESRVLNSQAYLLFYEELL